MNSEIFKKVGYIKDAHIDGKKFYIASDSNVGYDKLIDDLGSEYEIICVPGFAGQQLGRYDFSSLKYQKLSETLRSSGISNFKIEQTFKNQSKGFDRSLIKKKEKNTDADVVSDKPAFIYNGDIDYSKMICSSLSELISMRKDSKQTILYITEHGEEEQTYGELYEVAAGIAAAMQKAGIKKNDKFIFQFKSNRSFVECYWACVLIGAVVIPVGVLEDYYSRNVNADKLAKICGLFDNVYIIYDKEIQNDVLGFINNYELKCGSFCAEQFMGGESDEYIANPLGYEEPCLYFFTSGSTGMPKSVGLTQKNVFARTLGEIQMYGFNSNISDFNWMTLTHAAGLIWSHIRDVYLDAFQALSDTSVILAEPLRLLEYFNRFGTTTSWAPNFAYAMAANAIDENKDYGWNLSAANNIYSGGEANVSKTMRAFLKKTEKYGFPAKGLKPAFGMTETSSCITYYNELCYADTSDNELYVPIGTPGRGIAIRIADSNNNLLCEGETGYLQIKGDTLLSEYYNNPEANASSFTPDGYFITGDLGFIKDKIVTLTGREKDIIIINGLNYYIQDIEDTADGIDGVDIGNTAVVSVIESDGESVILFFVPKDEQIFEPENINELKALVATVKREIQKKSFVTLNHVIPIRRENFPRTEIGKKQRNPLKKAYSECAYESILLSISETTENGTLRCEKKALPIMFEGGIPNDICVCGNGSKLVESFLCGLGVDNNTAIEESENIVDFTFLSERSEEYLGFNRDAIERAFKLILSSAGRYADAEKPVKVVFPVLISKESFDIVSCSVGAVMRTLSLENRNFTFKIVYMDKYDATVIKNEICSFDKYEEITYEDGTRYLNVYETCSGICRYENFANMIENKLVVLIGGAGGIGKLLCKYLSDNYNCRIGVISRRNCDEANEIFRREGIKNVIFQSADITDRAGLEAAFSSITAEAGVKIGCIFNLTAKAVPRDDEMTISRILSEGREELYINSAEVKLSGLENAEHIRNKYGCRMYVLGSVTSDFGMVNMSAYSASNLLAKKYCEYVGEDELIFIGLSGWNNIGMNLKRTGADMKDFLSTFNTDKNGFLQGFTAVTGVTAIENILLTNTKSCLAGIDNNFIGLQSSICDEMNYTLTLTLRSKKMIAAARKVIEEQFPELKQYIVYAIDPMSEFSGNEGTDHLSFRMRRIWSRVLDKEICDDNDNLFDIGGNSLAVFKLASMIKEELGIELRPVDIMTYSTVKSLSGYIMSRFISDEKTAKKEETPVRKRTLKRGNK